MTAPRTIDLTWEQEPTVRRITWDPTAERLCLICHDSAEPERVATAIRHRLGTINRRQETHPAEKPWQERLADKSLDSDVKPSGQTITIHPLSAEKAAHLIAALPHIHDELLGMEEGQGTIARHTAALLEPGHSVYAPASLMTIHTALSALGLREVFNASTHAAVAAERERRRTRSFP